MDDIDAKITRAQERIEMLGALIVNTIWEGNLRFLQ